MQQDMIVILDLGSHENTMVARAVRELGVYSEIKPHDITAAELKELPNVKGIIINGGENNIIDGQPIDVEAAVYQFGVPVMSVGHTLAKVENLPAWPEHTAMLEVLKKFVFDECHATANWNMKNFINDQIELIKKQVGDKKVLLALSGGVDSSVVAALLIKAIGSQLTCVHVNHGLLRKGEREQVRETFEKNMGLKLIVVDAVDRFMGELAGVTDPEQKRKIIGREFVNVFQEEAEKLSNAKWLAQGTIYPDVIESAGAKTKKAKTIKSHHNVGGLPDCVDFKDIVEPLRRLFKDEVRQLGLELGLPEQLVWRQPFPGPGLAIRVIGEITEEKLAILRDADAIFREEMALAGLDRTTSQYFAVLTDLRSVGVMGDERTYDYTLALRAVQSQDFMTATWSRLPYELLDKISGRIVGEVKHINRIVYDITSKPPATVEWE